jgi:hypothetical protein
MCHDSADRETYVKEVLPKNDVWFGDRRIRSEEGDDCMGVSSGNGEEKGGGVEWASIEEVWRFYKARTVSNNGQKKGLNRILRFVGSRAHTSARFESKGTEGKDPSREAGL